MHDGPLRGLRVLDFTMLLPGPLATLLLAEAGATVLKVEAPGGDPLRAQGPFDAAGRSVPFEMLNRGKHLQTLDLKDPAQRAVACELVAGADVLVEQFRPGVMERLGLDAPTLMRRHPRLVYCSITGYARDGAEAVRAGHDLNYVADCGMLANVADAAGAPALPPTLIADIGGGAWPAVINILLALLARGADGRGRRIDIPMADNLWPFQLMPLAELWARGAAAAPGAAPLTGGLARYQLYRTRDGRWLAVAALEARFLDRFLELAGLPPTGVVEPTRESIAARIAEETAEWWLARLAGADVCVSLVRDLGEALAASPSPALAAFLGPGAGEPPPLPLPLDLAWRRPGSPALPADGWPPDA
ncbi:MAG: CoA transferase [Proteobacteria bacterium]|nr:CoA transferase [Pseudomonadota bacterium]